MFRLIRAAYRFRRTIRRVRRDREEQSTREFLALTRETPGPRRFDLAAAIAEEEVAAPVAWAVAYPGTKTHALWTRIFGTDAIPLASMTISAAVTPLGTLPMIQVDATRLTTEQICAIANRAADKFPVDPEEIVAEIRQRGTFPTPGLNVVISPCLGCARSLIASTLPPERN